MLAGVDSVNIEEEMEATLDEISSIEQQIYAATAQSRKLVEQIFALSSKLEEAELLRDRYKSLRSQYSADIKRLRFIIEGEEKHLPQEKIVKCPFCDNLMQNRTDKKVTYSEASKAELDRISLQLADLKNAETDIQVEIISLEAELKELNRQNSDITRIISNSLKPKAEQLKNSLASYKRILQVREELYAVDTLSTNLNTDAFQQENYSDTEQQRFQPMDHIDLERWRQWSEIFEAVVKKCGYPNCVAARISPDTHDAVINGKRKSDEGKGYRAFINSILLFALMKTLEDGCAYRPAMLILDSPILTLKEKVRPDELADAGMRASLFNYIIAECGDNQVIIAENEIPPETLVDYSSANLIEFTQDEAFGRYGFLKSVTNGANG